MNTETNRREFEEWETYCDAMMTQPDPSERPTQLKDNYERAPRTKKVWFECLEWFANRSESHDQYHAELANLAEQLEIELSEDRAYAVLLENKLQWSKEQRDRLAEALWNMLNQEHGSAIKAGILLRSLNLQYLNPNTKDQERKSPASDGSEIK